LKNVEEVATLRLLASKMC